VLAPQGRDRGVGLRELVAHPVDQVPDSIGVVEPANDGELSRDGGEIAGAIVKPHDARPRVVVHSGG
jgi:hypothetical protein